MMDNSSNSPAEPLLLDQEGQPVAIPLGGSLDLLAWGDVGYLAWKAKRVKHKNTNDDS